MDFSKNIFNLILAALIFSFFGPFYSGYNVIAIDTEYKYALICGTSFKYLWILSRDKTMPDNIKKGIWIKPGN